MVDAEKHYLFTDFGDVPLGETTENLKVGDAVKIGGIKYKVVGDSGTSREYHEIYVTEATLVKSFTSRKEVGKAKVEKASDLDNSKCPSCGGCGLGDFPFLCDDCKGTGKKRR